MCFPTASYTPALYSFLATEQWERNKMTLPFRDQQMGIFSFDFVFNCFKKKSQAFCTNAFTSEYFATSKGNFYELEFMKNKLQVEGRDVSVKQHFRNCTFSEGGNYVFFTPWFLSFVSVTLELKENWKCWQTWTRWMWNVSPCFCITLLLIFLWFFSRYLWRCQIFLNLCEWQN